jgi:plastin-1
VFRYTLNVLVELGRYQGLGEVTEEHIVKWANEKVRSTGKMTQMRSLKDSNLKTAMFFLDLVHAIEPRAVDWEIIQRPKFADDRDANMMNAKYVISAARKIGACVFLTPEDIIEVKSKMILTFVAGLWMADLVRFQPTVK